MLHNAEKDSRRIKASVFVRYNNGQMFRIFTSSTRVQLLIFAASFPFRRKSTRSDIYNNSCPETDNLENQIQLDLNLSCFRENSC